MDYNLSQRQGVLKIHADDSLSSQPKISMDKKRKKGRISSPCASLFQDQKL